MVVEARRSVAVAQLYLERALYALRKAERIAEQLKVMRA
jgi:hypothetical protein